MSSLQQPAHEGDIVALESVYTQQEMAARLNEMRAKLGIVQSFFKDVMVKTQDYGIIPGTDKPTLLKAGAEKLCELYGFAISIKDLQETADQITGYYRAIVTVALTHRRTGTIVAEGVGEANTNEGRYRWRWVPDFKLPKGFDTTGIHSEERTSKKNKSYKAYRIENEDPWTLWNTVLKMAKKRALIDATLSATRSSGLFTQDIEDLEEWVETGHLPEENTATSHGEKKNQGSRQQRANQGQNGKVAGNGNGRNQQAAATPQATTIINDLKKQLNQRVRDLGMSPEEWRKIMTERCAWQKGQSLTDDQIRDLLTYLEDPTPAEEPEAFPPGDLGPFDNIDAELDAAGFAVPPGEGGQQTFPWD